MSDKPLEYRDFLGDGDPRPTQHVCGLTGYDPMRDPLCPACKKTETGDAAHWRAEAERLAAEVERLEERVHSRSMLMADAVTVAQRYRAVLEDIASGELGINVAIKSARRALAPPKEGT